MRLCVAGSRDFATESYYYILEHILDEYLSNHPLIYIEIVSGNARGADSFGEKYALSKNIPLKVFQADWNTYGKRAGILRNKDMAEYADMFILFWDGASRGTKNMFDQIKRLKKDFIIYNFNGDKIYEYKESIERSRENLLNWMV